MLAAMPDLVDHYAVLGLPPTATTAEIRRAFRRLVAREHADRHGSDPGAVERNCRLNLARDTLVDPQRRAAFDRARREQAAPTPPDPLLDTVARTFGTAPPPRPAAPRAPTVQPAPAWLRDAAVGLLAAVAAVGVGASVGAAIREARVRARQPRR